MWTNQDEMFSEGGIEGLSEADEKAIEYND